MLELGPGPGVTTECLHDLGADLTCVEIHTGYATSIARRMPNDRVQVLAGDASVMPLADASFDTVVCFTMLHHLPSKILQDRVLAEVLRVLRPGGVFIGTDGLADRIFRLIHLFDEMEPVNPETFPQRLRAAGFEAVHIGMRQRDFRFKAYKPATSIGLANTA